MGGFVSRIAEANARTIEAQTEQNMCAFSPRFCMFKQIMTILLIVALIMIFLQFFRLASRQQELQQQQQEALPAQPKDD